MSPAMQHIIHHHSYDSLSSYMYGDVSVHETIYLTIAYELTNTLDTCPILLPCVLWFPEGNAHACHLICHPLIDGSSNLRTLPRSSTSRVNHLSPLRIQLQPTPHNVYSPTSTSNELCRIQSLKNNKSIHFNFHKDISNIFLLGLATPIHAAYTSWLGAELLTLPRVNNRGIRRGISSSTSTFLTTHIVYIVYIVYTVLDPSDPQEKSRLDD